MSAGKIHSQRVILIEGEADEFVPKEEAAAGMHGFAIMVPSGDGGERLLDMVWRITIAYAGMPRLLMSRTNVRKMVEAVMSAGRRENKPARVPARKSGEKIELRNRDRLIPVDDRIRPGTAPKTKLRRAIASLPVPKAETRSKTRKRS